MALHRRRVVYLVAGIRQRSSDGHEANRFVVGRRTAPGQQLYQLAAPVIRFDEAAFEVGVARQFLAFPRGALPIEGRQFLVALALRRAWV